MPSVLQPALRRLLGGETRAKVLGLLADATVPKTGYELAKAARANPSKVYGILRDLADAGLVQVLSDRPGVRRYSLTDPDLRRFLLRHVRITTLQEWFSPARVRQRETSLDRPGRNGSCPGRPGRSGNSFPTTGSSNDLRTKIAR